MSFGSQTGRTRSGAKGFSGKDRKQKRKKQEFHAHRRSHEQESGRLDPEALRARTLLTLERLGHQVLSTEPGGYDLEHWVRSVNSLLDDFQEKIGEDVVTDEFRKRREETTGSLVVSSASRDIESEISKLALEEVEAKEAIEQAYKKAAARLASLKEERSRTEKTLKTEREGLSELRKSKQSRGLFSRVLRAGPSTEEGEAAVAKLEQEVHRLDEDIEASRKARGAGEGDPGQLEAQQRLESIREKQEHLQAARLSTLQLALEREAAARAISAAISSLKLQQTSSSESAVQVQ